jgi:hypothetical protein
MMEPQRQALLLQQHRQHYSPTAQERHSQEQWWWHAELEQPSPLPPHYPEEEPSPPPHHREEPEQPRVIALSAVAAKRPRDADRKGSLAHFKPLALAEAAVRGAVMGAFAIFEDLLKEYDGEMDKVIEVLPDLNLEKYKQPLVQNALYFFSKNTCQTSLLRFFEYLAWDVFKCLKAAGKLTKDYIKSAQRKALRFGRVGAFVPVLKTALWSNALNWTSVLVVDWVFILGECVVQPSAGKKTVGGAPKQKKPVLEAVKEAAPRFRQSAVACATSYALISAGAAAGTLILPGAGTNWGGVVADAYVQLLK